MKFLLNLCAMFLLCISFNSITAAQEKDSKSKSDEAFVEIVIHVKNIYAYYCRSEDLLQWPAEFIEQMKVGLFPLLSNDGNDHGVEFDVKKHIIRMYAPRKNLEAVRKFWTEQEKSKPDASEEERKKGVTRNCS